MPIPDFQTLMLPLLKYVGDDKEHTLRETIESLSREFALNDTERNTLLPSGNQLMFDNRVGWARTYLKKAGLIESPKRAVFKITQRGKDVLKEKPEVINMNYLQRFPEYMEFVAPDLVKSAKLEELKKKAIELSKRWKTEKIIELRPTPEESLESAYQEIRNSLIQDLLAKVKNMPPAFFERLVIELLVRMGYGGSIQDAGKAIGKSGDEGIDGVIKEDKLGLEKIYMQAKRWEGTVGRPEIQKFVGALAGQGAKKGVFITTSYFSKEALSYEPKNETKIVLVDGVQLAEYMIDYGLGVSTVITYEVKKLDSDYFGEE